MRSPYRLSIMSLLSCCYKNCYRQKGRETEKIIDYHKRKVMVLPTGDNGPRSIMYLALKRATEQYRPKAANGDGELAL